MLTILSRWMIRKTILLVNVLFTAAAGFSQCPTASFNTPIEVCTDENINLINASSGAARYEWDFCAGDLSGLPSKTSDITNSLFNKPSKITIVNEADRWYGFVASRFGKRVVKLDFGSDLKNDPRIVNLGNLENSFEQPIDIEFFQEDDKWYALVIDVAADKLFRLNFLDLSNNAPVVEEITTLSSLNLLDAPTDLAIIDEPGNVTAIITNFSAANVTHVSFGNSILNNPTSTNYEVVGASNLQGVSAIKVCEGWQAIVTSEGNSKFYQLNYQNGLSTAPAVSEIVTGSGISRPIGISIVEEASVLYAFVQSFSGNLYRVEEPLTIAPSIDNLGNFSSLPSANQGVALENMSSMWYGFSVNINANRISRFQFSNVCSTSKGLSSQENPSSLVYSQSGTYTISLTAIDEGGNSNSIVSDIVVKSDEAPVVDFVINEAFCTDTPSDLIGLSPFNDITAWRWNFGDGSSTSSNQETTHQYTSPGTYEVTLEVESTNGCGNRLTKEITIYEPPSPNFTAPTGQICTNGAAGFTNTTDAKGADVDSLITYQWFVDDELVSEEANPDITFANGGDQTVRLEASIPGCTEITEQTVSVLQGPTVNFNVAQICQGDPIAFENLTTGDGVTGYAWDFGDGGTFSSVAAESPTYTFTEAGTYTVALRVDNTLGCQNIYQQEVTVFEQPSVGFVSDVACVGTPTQFTDTTTAGVNANVIAWQWDFGDNLGTAAVRNPTYAYPQPGTYDVRLTTQTTAGCTDAIQKTITVESPVTAGFAAVPQCPTAAADYRILFSDTSLVTAGDEVTRWFWTIGEASFVTREVEYSFPGPGDYEVSLTAFAASGCNAIVRRTVRVDSLPALDFTADASVCTSQTVAFRSAVNPFGRAITEYAWSVSNPAGEEVSTAFEADPSFAFDEPGAHEVTLSVSTEAGCTFSRTQSVAVTATPLADFTATPARGGAPLVVNFAGASVEGTEYQWDFGGVNSADEVSPTFTFNEPGSYTVTLTARNEAGCESTTQQTIEVLNPVQDVRLESLSIVDNPNGPGQRLLLTVRNVGSLPADSVSVTINFGDAVSVQEGLPEPLLAGETRVYVTRFQLPASTSTVRYLCATLRVDDVSFVDARPEDNRNCASLDQQLTVEPPFPNPAADRLQVPVILPEAAAVSLRLTNLNGKVMQSYRQADAPAGLNTFIIRTKGMPVGTYLLQIDYQGEQRQFRVSVAP